jgi:anti-sigma regulatory factor (Ser/Thr protein kinase)
VHARRSVPDKSDRAYRWQRLFRGHESELRQLRHWLTELLPDSPGRDDLISVAVELGTNAVQHTASGDGGWFTVEVACRGPVMRVSVTDEGAERGPSLAPLGLGEAPGLGTDSVFAGARCDRGRGLVIVRALAVTCGVCGNASGRTVWAEIAQAQAQTEAETQAGTRTQAQPPVHTRTPSLSPPGTPNGQGRSSRPSASSAMAISRTL